MQIKCYRTHRMERLIPDFEIRNYLVENMAFDLRFEGCSKFQGVWLRSQG